MKHEFFRRCSKCDEVIKFEEKDRLTVHKGYCKKCRKYYTIQEVKDYF